MENNTRSKPSKLRGRPRGWHDKTTQNTIKSLDRAMHVFEYLADHPGKTLTALSKETGQSAATLYRVLVTLETRGLVEFSSTDQLWHIGARAFTIGSQFLRRTSIAERAQPIMRRLMEATGETANLGIEREQKVLFLSQVETHASIRAFFPPGTLSQMHASGIGKALLAHMDQDRLTRFLSKNTLRDFTRNTITDPQTLREELKEIRLAGYSIDREERNDGMLCIAAPVFDVNAEAVAGISVSGPTTRMQEGAIEAHRQHVQQAAIDLTEAIGGQKPSSV